MSGPAVWAQSTDRIPAALQARLSSRADAFESALGLVANGKQAAAEATLLQHNFSKAGTLEWSTESALRLAQVALVLRERADYRNANLVASRAIELLTTAKTTRFAGAASSQRARVFEVEGYIYERLLPNLAAAKAAFSEAQRELPSSDAAQAGLDRVKEIEDQIARLPGKKG